MTIFKTTFFEHIILISKSSSKSMLFKVWYIYQCWYANHRLLIHSCFWKMEGDFWNYISWFILDKIKMHIYPELAEIALKSLLPFLLAKLAFHSWVSFKIQCIFICKCLWHYVQLNKDEMTKKQWLQYSH